MIIIIYHSQWTKDLGWSKMRLSIRYTIRVQNWLWRLAFWWRKRDIITDKVKKKKKKKRKRKKKQRKKSKKIK